MSRSGADLALLLLGGYRLLVDRTVDELAEQGFEDVRPVHEFALRAIDAGADTASELGRRMSVSKQAAGKTLQTLLDRGWVAPAVDGADARSKRFAVTPRGSDLMRQGEAALDRLRADWEQRLGTEELTQLEDRLRALVGDSPVRIDAPGWVATTPGPPAPPARAARPS